MVNGLIGSKTRIETYNQNDLNELWALLKDVKFTSMNMYQPIGLVQVPFNLSVEEFTQAYHRKTNQKFKFHPETLISTDLEAAIDFLLQRELIWQHLSCAALEKSFSNTAIAIHVAQRQNGGFKREYLAIPGINYLPPIETIERWRVKKGGIDQETYRNWVTKYYDFCSTTQKDYTVLLPRNS